MLSILISVAGFDVSKLHALVGAPAAGIVEETGSCSRWSSWQEEATRGSSSTVASSERLSELASQRSRAPAGRSPPSWEGR